MKVLQMDKMPDGTDIQIEDWREDYPTTFDTVSIAAYPVAKNTGRYRLVQGGKRFRVSMCREWKTNDEVNGVYAKLISGEVNLNALSDHFWNGDKDRWHLGMDVEYKGW